MRCGGILKFGCGTVCTEGVGVVPLVGCSTGWRGRSDVCTGFSCIVGWGEGCTVGTSVGRGVGLFVGFVLGSAVESGVDGVGHSPQPPDKNPEKLSL